MLCYRYGLLVVMLLASGSSPLPAADTLVVIRPEFRAAITAWQAYRESQGHTLRIENAPPDAGKLRDLVKRCAQQEDLRYVVLVGDCPPRGGRVGGGHAIPVGYSAAKVNVEWGSLPQIATDNQFADLDDDLAPDLAMGRIPCHTPEQLRHYLKRVVDRERSASAVAEGLTIVASPGRFSPWIDALIEMTAQRVLKQLAPEGCPLTAIHASPHSPYFPQQGIREAVLGGLSTQCLAWVYLGHAGATQLDRLWDEPGQPSMLCCADLRTRAEGDSPAVAALLACSTGSIDEQEDCLAESLLLCPGGPLVVIASSRVSMPYGNSVLGAELLHCLFHHPGSVGDLVAEGKRRALQADSGLPLRAALTQIGLGASPRPELLELEVAEHVQMYNLLGDPLVRVR